MAGNSNIGWTNKTWNPVRGCERVSEGCRNCYAEELAARHSYEGGWGEGVAKYVIRPGGVREARWTGVIEIAHQKTIDAPLHWRDPARVFVNSMSDLFHDRVPFPVIDEVFSIMESVACAKHTFQVLTKRPLRMQKYLERRWGGGAVPAAMRRNIWIGVSVEDQAAAAERIPLLANTPAAVRWISAEPLLGSVSIEPWARSLNWVVIGGESGSGFREMDMAHARALGHQCVAAGVPVFVKQDSGPRPGHRGRFTDAEWALKEYPA